MASHQKVLPFSKSNAFASIAFFGILIPNLCVLIHYLDLSFEIIRFLFLIVKGTHQAKAGSSAMFDAIAYSARSTGYAFFESFNGIRVVLPSFH
jgi:hypothetical protein